MFTRQFRVDMGTFLSPGFCQGLSPSPGFVYFF
jgi:hypothetical protein